MYLQRVLEGLLRIDPDVMQHHI